MPLLKNGELIEDEWLTLEDDAPLPPGNNVIISLDRLQREDAGLKSHDGRIGVALPNDIDADVLTPYLQALDLIVLTFPAFTDGRAYSQARQLRQAIEFQGELRASGNVLPDQLAFMRQCGIDVFEIDSRFDINVWQRAATAMSLTYQRGYTPERGFAPAEVLHERSKSSHDQL